MINKTKWCAPGKGLSVLVWGDILRSQPDSIKRIGRKGDKMNAAAANIMQRSFANTNLEFTDSTIDGKSFYSIVLSEYDLIRLSCCEVIAA
jgi:hypothetical protein